MKGALFKTSLEMSPSATHLKWRVPNKIIPSQPSTLILPPLVSWVFFNLISLSLFLFFFFKKKEKIIKKIKWL